MAAQTISVEARTQFVHNFKVNAEMGFSMPFVFHKRIKA